MADISKIKTPNGTSYDIKDAVARGRSLPVVTSSDNGKVLRVVNGEWSVVSLPSASGVSF